MAFEGLTEKLSATFKKLRGKGRLKESDVKEAMREIRLALLEADVSYKVVKDFTKSVTERCIGADVLESLTPAQMIVKIVNEELTRLMGSETQHITINPKGPTVVMLVGLQGAGKTTNGSKLAGLMKRQGRTSTAPPPSGSWRSAARSWVCRCSKWVRPIRWTSPRLLCSMPFATAMTWCSWILPAGSTSMRH